MRKLSLALCAAVFMFIPPGGLAAKAEHGRQGAAIPSGTQLRVRLLDRLDTGQSNAGQSFAASVAEPVVVAGRTVLARGAEMEGRVSEVVSSGRLKRPASITLELTSVPTDPLRIDGKSHLVRNAALIGGGAGAGALIGGALEGMKGAAIGAAIGGGGGAATAYLTGKKEIVLPAETELTFVVASKAERAETPAFWSEPGEATQASEHPSADSRGRAIRARQHDDDGNEGWESSPDHGPRRTAAEEEREPEFSGRDQELIRRYFSTYSTNLPPGLAKRGGNLPPGLERHLERNGTLPPGLQKRVEPFPADLSRQLPQLPAGYSRVILANRALIVDRDNQILDLMFIDR